MSYTLNARKPGAQSRYAAPTPEAALAAAHELRARGYSFAIIDNATGAQVDEVDLEDIIDSREAADAQGS